MELDYSASPPPALWEGACLGFPAHAPPGSAAQPRGSEVYFQLHREVPGDSDAPLHLPLVPFRVLVRRSAVIDGGRLGNFCLHGPGDRVAVPAVGLLFDAHPRLLKASAAYADRREELARFHDRACAAVAAWQHREAARLRRAWVVDHVSKASPSDVAAILREAGAWDALVAEYAGELRGEARRAALTRAQVALSVTHAAHVEAVLDALRPAAEEIERAGLNAFAPGPYPPGLKGRLRSNFAIKGRHYSSYLVGRRTPSSAAGGTRDECCVLPLLRKWAQWRPVVLGRLDAVQRSVREAAGDAAAAELLALFGLSGPAGVMPEAPTPAEFLAGAATLLLLRCSVRFVRGDGTSTYLSNDQLRVLFTTFPGAGGTPGQRRPESYSLMHAVKTALPETAADMEGLDAFYSRLFDEMGTRNARRPCRKAKYVPHSLTVVWYFEKLRAAFDRELARDVAAGGGMTPGCAEVLRQLVVCMLSGGYVSPSRSTEAEDLAAGQYCLGPSGRVVTRDPDAFGCNHRACKAPNKCQGNRAVLVDAKWRSFVRVNHWKSGRDRDKHSHEILIPEELADLLRMWAVAGRPLVMRGKEDHGFLLCSSTGVRLSAPQTLKQAKDTLARDGVDVSHWADLSTVRDIRRLFLERKAHEGGIAVHLDRAVRAEQAARGLPQVGIQGDASDAGIQAAWRALTIGARSSNAQAENHYTLAVSTHAHMCEILLYLRKHIVSRYPGKHDVPERTNTNVIPGQMFEMDADEAPEEPHAPLKRARVPQPLPGRVPPAPGGDTHPAEPRAPGGDPEEPRAPGGDPEEPRAPDFDMDA